MLTRHLSAVVVMVTLTLVFVGGCKPDLIPGTQVEDSEENRKVLEFLTRYQAAMQARKVDAVVTLCAADYYEPRRLSSSCTSKRSPAPMAW